MSGIFRRIFVSYLAVILITLATVHLATSYLFADYYFAAKEKEMQHEAQQIAAALAGQVYPLGTAFSTGNPLFALEERMVVLDRRQFDFGHHGRGPGRRLWLGTEEAARLLAGETVSVRQVLPATEREVLAVAAPVSGANGDITGAVLLFAPIADLDATVAAVRRITLAAATVAVFLAAAFSLWFSRSLSAPLREMSRVSVEMARGNFDRRVTVNGRDEIGQLADNLNRLAGSLDRSVGELAREKGKLESIVTNMTEGVLAVDTAGRIILANIPARNALGLGAGAAPVQEHRSLPVPALSALFDQVLATGRVQSAELDLGGTYILAQCSPLRRPDGEIFGTVAVLQDITALRRLEQMRRDFVAHVSHELRTPLTAVQGIIEGLIDGVISEAEAREQYLAAAHRQTLRMNRLVRDLLDLAAIEAGRTDWEQHAVDLRDVLARLEVSLKSILEEKQLALNTEIPDELPPLLANESRLEQVLVNLIENAVRYSPPRGAILVSAARQPDGGIKVTVRDQGPGIPPADLPYVWDRFYRVEKSRSREAGGTGLGLAIVKEIVEAQGGTVGVESPPGAGATFWFILPAADTGAEKNNQEP